MSRIKWRLCMRFVIDDLFFLFIYILFRWNLSALLRRIYSICVPINVLWLWSIHFFGLTVVVRFFSLFIIHCLPLLRSFRSTLLLPLELYFLLYCFPQEDRTYMFVYMFVKPCHVRRIKSAIIRIRLCVLTWNWIYTPGWLEMLITAFFLPLRVFLICERRKGLPMSAK